MTTKPHIHIIGVLLVLLLVFVSPSPAMATAGTVAMWGTNVSNAQANTTVTSAPQNITVTAWNVGGIKTFRSTVNNASDSISFTISNITVGQVQALTVNSTPINAYQANSNGAVTFTYTQTTGTATYQLQAASNQAGANYSWAWIWGGKVSDMTCISGCSGFGATGTNGTNGTNGVNGTNFNYTINITGSPGITGNVTLVGSGNVTLTQVGSNITIWANITNGINGTNGANGASGTNGVNGSSVPIYNGTNITSNYTIGATNVSGSFYTVYADAGTLNVTLPTPSTVANGTFYNIKKKDSSANSVNVNVTSAGTIDGGAWANLTTQYSSITLVRYDQEYNII